jgi:hypothetical protein
MKHDPIWPSPRPHPLDCDCDADLCRKARFTRRAVDPRPLGADDFVWHAAAGIVVGNAIAFLYDPHGALSALAACFGVSL